MPIGGLSSAVERLPVEEDVMGSIPIDHPNKKSSHCIIFSIYLY